MRFHGNDSFGRRCLKWETTSGRMRCCETSPGLPRGGRWNISCLIVETENGKKDINKIHEVVSRIWFDVWAWYIPIYIYMWVMQYQIHVHCRYKTSSERMCIIEYNNPLPHWLANIFNRCAHVLLFKKHIARDIAIFCHIHQQLLSMNIFIYLYQKTDCRRRKIYLAYSLTLSEADYSNLPFLKKRKQVIRHRAVLCQLRSFSCWFNQHITLLCWKKM